jgi:hypothetical protein
MLKAKAKFVGSVSGPHTHHVGYQINTVKVQMDFHPFWRLGCRWGRRMSEAVTYFMLTRFVISYLIGTTKCFPVEFAESNESFTECYYGDHIEEVEMGRARA